MPKPLIFTLINPLYDLDVVVVVGGGTKDLLAFAKKNSPKEFIKACEEIVLDEGVNEAAKNANAFACQHKESGYQVLFLKTYRDDWDYWETLLHECVHLTQFFEEERCMSGEREALAYYTQWLFKTIRKTIQSMPTLKNKRTGKTAKLAKKTRQKPRRINKRKVA